MSMYTNRYLQLLLYYPGLVANVIFHTKRIFQPMPNSITITDDALGTITKYYNSHHNSEQCKNPNQIESSCRKLYFM